MTPADDDQSSDPFFRGKDRDDSGETIPLQPPRDPLEPMKPGGGPASAYHSPLEHRIEPAADDGESYSFSNPPPNYGASDKPVWQTVQQVKPDLTPTPDPLARPKPKTRKKGGSLVGCNVIVFLASVCVMVLELTASRLIAKHVGSSLYTWTSVIGVVLLGITVGNFIGGWLADRFDPNKLVARLFLLASAACFSVLWLDQLVGTGDRPENMDWPVWVFLTVAQMFFIPATVLGTISPVVASVALAKRRSTGMTVGSVYAWGALGSIVGTFLTGFYLIDTFGTKAIIGGTSGMLAVIGVFVATGQTLFRSAVAFGWLQFLLITTAAAAATEDAGRLIGGWIGSVTTSHDSAVVQLDEWYNSSGLRLPDFAREDLLERCRSRSVDGLNEEAVAELKRWLRSGQRQDLTDDTRAAIKAAIQHEYEHNVTIEAWQNHTGDIAGHLHELGILLWLRSDQSGEYHDESNYSYINVSDGFEDGESVKQLQLDKLMHSYFNPADPTRLYYEYEKIYAEITDRVAAGWDRRTTVKVPSSPGLPEIVGKLPPWVTYDAAAKTLSVPGAVSESRRKDLINASAYAEYWLAVERLGLSTRSDFWGGFSSETIQTIPEGALTDDFWKKRLSYDSSFKKLNVYEELSEQDEDKLCAAGAAKSHAPWREVVRSLSRNSRATSTFFIGGGGFVFPRWIEIEYPKSARIDVAELDPAVKLAVQEAMGLAPDGETLVRTLIGDARNVTDDLLREQQRLEADGKKLHYDFVYGDAFNDFGVPWHLTTQEYTQKVSQLLDPEHGVYLVNVIDIWPRAEYPPEELAESALVGIPKLPTEIFGKYLLTEDWIMMPAFPGFETQPLEDGTHRIGYRGRMTPEMRDDLKKLAPASPEFVKGVERLYTKSNQAQAGRFLSSYVNTIAQEFPNIYVFSTEPGPPSPWRDTFVIAASKKPLPLDDLPSTGEHWQIAPFATRVKQDGQTVDGGQMKPLLHTARNLVLTDDYAPVDTLLKPVFVDQY
ncbi:MAG: fused MFS/spermidine synthase [Planctomycetota bacterium]|nr:fused MFS/spermidine synthase [Planctomycetota bacterium]MDA1248453.1 fused MFS/spermidine synthase [Planctomycetota bacterium]